MTESSAKRTDTSMVLNKIEPRPSPQRFVDLWNGLSEELRVKILKYVLEDSRDDRIDEFTIRKHVTKDGTADQNKLATLFLRPDFNVSHLARQILYSSNKIYISVGDGPPKYPAPGFNCFIHVLRIHVPIRSREWSFLSKIANGTLGFRGLRDLTLFFHWHFGFSWKPMGHREVDVFIKTMDRIPLSFSVKSLTVQIEDVTDLEHDDDVREASADPDWVNDKTYADFKTVNDKIFSQTQIHVVGTIKAPETSYETHTLYIGRKIKY